MTLATLRTSLLNQLGRPTTDGFYTTAILNDFINEALQNIATEAHWPWLETSETITTVVGTDNYSPAANCMMTREVFYSGDQPLTYTSLATILRTNDSGRPFTYTYSQNKIIMRPIPSEALAYTHIYYRTEPILSGDSDVPILPSQFQYAIVQLAASYAYDRAGQTNEADLSRSQYDKALRRMFDFKRKSTGPISPTSTRDWS